MRIARHQNLAVEYTTAAAIEYAAVKLGAVGVADAMLDAGVMIDMLCAIGDEQAVQAAARAATGEDDIDIDARQLAAKGQ